TAPKRMLRKFRFFRRGWFSSMQSDMVSSSCMLFIRACAPDAAKSDVTGRCVDRLGMACGRPVAAAVVRRAKMRAALNDFPGNPAVGHYRVVAALDRKS